ncbi:regulator of telomere elongation helicase 1 isoform X1 [Tanacetum coccineum]
MTRSCKDNIAKKNDYEGSIGYYSNMPLLRELHKVVDILFAPYNYHIDPSNRKSLTIEWADSIMIFDEAHNLVLLRLGSIFTSVYAAVQKLKKALGWSFSSAWLKIPS